ncbi:MAG: hypothetical protein HY293_19970 [Planctomycetes bacterium]|nr:hypothetical protein [Planctomycetota bacterium]
MFPFLCRLALGSEESVGAAVARLYSWNTVGGILGALAGSFLLLPWRGIPGTILFAAGLNVILAAYAFSERPGAWKGVPPLTLAGGILLLLLVPGWDLALVATTPVLYGQRYFTESRSQGKPLATILRESNRIIYSKWDSCGLVTVHDAGKLRTLRINGKADASTEDDMATQILTAHLPLILHPAAREALVIGLGSGSTVAAALRHPVEAVEVVELLPAVVEASKFFEETVGPWRTDPRLRLVIGDARTHVRFTPRRYDVIAAEPSNLWLSGMATLFTREQFRRYRELLKPGGIVCQWVHAYRLPKADFAAVLATFHQVFPRSFLWEVSIGGDYLLVGMTGELPDYQGVRRRFETPAVAGQLKQWGRPTVEGLLRDWIGGTEMIDALTLKARLISDDDCHVEYSAPRGLLQDSRMETLEALDLLRESYVESLPGAPDPRAGRRGRRMLASAVRAAPTEGASAAFALLEGALVFDAGDPALAVVLDSLSRRAFLHAAGLARRGELEAARDLFRRIPRESPIYEDAKRALERLGGN